jgi:predicted DNA-binding protein (UPF0251 family)
MVDTKPRSTNSSGVTGVTFDRATSLWRAQLTHKCEDLFVGLWPSKEDAIRVRAQVEEKIIKPNVPLETAIRICREIRSKQPRRDRRRFGENNSQSKITAQEVRKIRQLASEGTTQQSIADELGISRTCVSSIVLRRTWDHVA